MNSLLRDRDVLYAGCACLFIVIITSLFYIFYYMASANGLQSATKEMMNVKKSYAFWMKEEKKRTEIISSFNLIESIYNRIDKEFRSGEFSASIASTAASSGVVIFGETYKPAGKDGVNYVQIDIEGEYPKVRTFMDGIVDFPHFVLIDKFTLKVNEGGIVSARIVLTVFSRKGAGNAK